MVSECFGPAIYSTGQHCVCALLEVDNSTVPPTVNILGYAVFDLSSGAVVAFGETPEQCIAIIKDIEAGAPEYEPDPAPQFPRPKFPR